jgi:hypothetical protein
MITTTIYHKQNVLHLSFKGHVCLYHFYNLEGSLPSTFRYLRPEFTLMTDLSGVEEIDFVCGAAFADLMERVVEAGVGQVLRVVPDPRKDIGLGILAVFHYPHSLPVRVYEDLSEAMKALAIDYELALNDNYEPAPNTDIVMRNGQN